MAADGSLAWSARRAAFTEGVVAEGYLVRERRGARKVAKPALLYERLRDAVGERLWRSPESSQTCSPKPSHPVTS